MKKRIISILMAICIIGSMTTNAVYATESISLNVIESVNIETEETNTETNNGENDHEEVEEIEVTESVEEEYNTQEFSGYSLSATSEEDLNTIFFNGDGIGQSIAVESNPVEGDIEIRSIENAGYFSGGGYTESSSGSRDIVLFPDGDNDPIVKFNIDDESVEEIESKMVLQEENTFDDNNYEYTEYIPWDAAYFGGIVAEEGNVYLNPSNSYGDIGKLNIYDGTFETPEYQNTKLCSALVYNADATEENEKVILIKPTHLGTVRAAYNSRNGVLYVSDANGLVGCTIEEYQNCGDIDNIPRLISYKEDFGDTVGSFGGIFITTDNKVILTPASANCIIIYDIETEMYKTIDIPIDIQSTYFKYNGGAYDGRYIWLAPYGAEKMLRFDTLTERMRTYDLTAYGATADGYCGGIFDGENVWLVPYGSDGLVKISNSSKDTHSELGLTVCREYDGQVVEGVKVVVSNDEFEDVYYTDAEGKIDTWEYENGSTVTIEINKEGYEPYLVQRQIASDENVDISLKTDSSLSNVKVIVQDKQGNAIENTYISCGDLIVQTDSDGKANFVTQRSAQDIYIGKNDYVVEKVEKEATEASTITVVLEKNGNVLRPAEEYRTSGANHTLIINEDGTVSAFGDNTYGQLGTGDNISTNLPVQVSGLLDVVKVIADENYSMALASDGTLYSWGQNNYGQLGNGSVENSNIPQKIEVNENVKIIDLEAEDNHVIALSEFGEVYSWGVNIRGQVGKGLTSSYEKLPLKIEGLSNVVDISAGENFSSALSVDGKLYTWGDNTYGQLGKSGIALSNKPILADIDNVKSMSAGRAHTAVVKTDGTVWCFGDNSFTQCGSLTNACTAQAALVDVTGLSDIHCLVSGNDYIYAESSGGNVIRWGRNDSGQLGSTSSGTFEKMYLDDYTVYGVKGGKKYIWGLMTENSVAGLTKINTPVSINNYGNIAYVTAERDGNIMVDKSGNVYSWGNNSDGNLGYYAYSKQTYPQQINGLENIVKVAKGKYHALALDVNGELWGWGSNKNGELGLISYKRFELPQQLGITDVVDMAVGNNFSVVLASDGCLYTYGEDKNGKLGDGEFSDGSKTYVRKISGLGNVEKVECGDEFVVVLADGDVYTWGSNDVGQLGIGTEDVTRASYTKVLEGCVDISVNVNHVLALMENGEVYAWGAGTVGQLGQNNKENSNAPIKVQNLPSNIVRIGTGKGISLAVTSDGYLYSWGYGKDGQIGHGEFKSSLIPKKVESLSDVKYATAGTSHSVVILKDGTVKTFGDNANGQLGIYTSEAVELNEIETMDYVANIECVSGNTYMIAVSGMDIRDFGLYDFRIKYDPNMFELVDAAGQTYAKDTGIGNVTGTDIKIVNVADGEISFAKSMDIEYGYSHSGFINAIILKAIQDGNSEIRIDY